jgi:hypothetical protein
LTNLDCPGCGSQRALHALLHGNIIAAADQNLLAVLSVPFLFYSAIVNSANILFNKKWKQQIFYSANFVRVVLIFVLLFWVLRNIPAPPFSWLAAGT